MVTATAHLASPFPPPWKLSAAFGDENLASVDTK